MTGQLQLVEVAAEPRLTSRQQAVLAAVQHAGIDGLDADQAGALLHWRNDRHGPDDRCAFCGRDGQSILAKELRPKGLVKYRRAKGLLAAGWIAVGIKDDRLPPGMTTEIPF